MKKLSFLFAALVAICGVDISWAYSHADYNQTGLVVLYDGPDNVSSTTKLTNFGSLGSTYDLDSLSGDNTVVGGVIKVNGNSGKGWGMAKAASEATKGDTSYTDVGYTVEFVGKSLDADDTLRHVIGSDPNGTSPGPFRIGMIGNGSSVTGCEAFEDSYGYEAKSNYKGFESEVKTSDLATRTFTLNSGTGEVFYYLNGTYVGTFTATSIKDIGIKAINLGDLRKGRGYNAWKGEICSVRVYNRILSATEIAGNADTDAYRFLGKTEPGQLTIATSPVGIGRPVPSIGTYSAPKESLPCDAGEAFFENGVRYACTGYTLETKNEDGSWSDPAAYEGSSFDYVAGEKATRLTWLYAPTHYRLYVTKHGGYETFLINPLPDVADTDDDTLGGYYAADTVVSVTAVPSIEPIVSVFECWMGDIGTAGATDNPIAVKMDSARTLLAGFKRPWYKSADNEVSDGVWTFALEVLSGETIDDVSEPYQIKTCLQGSGVLDMSQLNIRLAEMGEKPIKSIGASVFNGNTAIAGIIFPCEEGEGIAIVKADAFRNCSNLTGTPNYWALENVPSRTTFLDNTKVTGDLLLPRLKTVSGDRNFRNNGYNGVLYAPELTSADTATFAGLSITNAILPKLTTWSEQLFYGCNRLQHIEASKDITKIAGNVFEGANFSCCVIDFPGSVPAQPGGVSGAKLILRVPGKYLSNWMQDEKFVALKDIVDVEKQANYQTASRVKKLMGMWNGAWLVATPTPGMMLLIR